jgi:hypothetical protein
MAVLRFDSRQTPLSAGVRSGETSARQLIFSAGEFELDLRLTPSNGRWAVEGQLLGPVTDGSVLLLSPESTHQTKLNELSEFRFNAVHGNRYTLQVQLDNVAITVPDVEIS